MRLMVAIYGSSAGDTLTSMRYGGYCTMSLSLQFQAERLPPSEGTVHMHAKCALYKAVVWKYLGET
jgi:hypothetical protein